MSMDIRRGFAVVIVVGLVVRYALGILYTYPTDINYWMTVTENIAAGESLYSLPGYYYTPVWGYFLALLTPFIQFSGIPLGEYAPEFVGSGQMAQDWNCVMPSIEFALVVKTFLFLADLAVMFLIYRVGCFMTTEKRSFVLASIWFLCPFVILISSVRVMFENLEIMFMLLAFYALLTRHPAAAGVAMGLSLMVKPYGIFLGLLMIGYSYAQSGSARYTLSYVIATMLTGLAVMLPVFMEGDLSEALMWMSNKSPGQSTGSSYNLVVYIVPVLLLLTLFSSAAIAREGNDDPRRILTIALVLMALMLVVPGNIQYYMMLIPLALLVPMSYKNAIPFMFAVLSVFAFLSYNDWSAALYIHYGFPGAGLLDSFSQFCSGLSQAVGYNPLKSLTAILCAVLPVVYLHRERCSNEA